MRRPIIIPLICLLSACNSSFTGNVSADGSSSSLPYARSEESKIASANEKLVPAQYVRWVEDEQNGLKKEKTIDDIIFSAQYKPAQYVVCEEERKDSITGSEVQKKLGELGGMQYYDLKITLKSGQGELLKYNLSSAEQYQDRVNYFSFGMQKDIQLVDGNDTLPCLLYHYERVYDVAPYGTFILGFAPGKNPKANKTLLLFDKGFNKGIVKLYFEEKDIEYVPQLQTI